MTNKTEISFWMKLSIWFIEQCIDMHVPLFSLYNVCCLNCFNKTWVYLLFLNRLLNCFNTEGFHFTWKWYCSCEKNKPVICRRYFYIFEDCGLVQWRQMWHSSFILYEQTYIPYSILMDIAYMKIGRYMYNFLTVFWQYKGRFH